MKNLNNLSMTELLDKIDRATNYVDLDFIPNKDTNKVGLDITIQKMENVGINICILDNILITNENGLKENDNSTFVTTIADLKKAYKYKGYYCLQFKEEDFYTDSTFNESRYIFKDLVNNKEIDLMLISIVVQYIMKEYRARGL